MQYGEPMGAGKSAGTGWQQTPVLIRSDIIAAAEREHLDISDACNRALAKHLGIEYNPLKKTVPEVSSKVIIAPDPAPADRKDRSPAALPVINAEDPTVPGKVMKEKKERKAPAATKPQAPPQEPALQHPVAPAPSGQPATIGAKDRAEKQKRRSHKAVCEHPDRTGD